VEDQRVRSVAGALLAAAALLVCSGGSAVSATACPPLKVEETWLALFAQEGRELSPAQRRALESSGVIRGYPGALWPPSGPAPLTVGLIWVVRPENPQAIEVDADGDGTPDIVDTRDEVFGYTYRQPGRYAATIRVRERGGEVRTYKSPVTVLTPGAFDAEIQARWTALKMALQQRDVEGALACVTMAAWQRTERLLRRAMRSNIEDSLPPIRFVKFLTAAAVYESVRPPTGDSRNLAVRFQVDVDGVWRLFDFGPPENLP
jgi:hypothetical protein